MMSTIQKKGETMCSPRALTLCFKMADQTLVFTFLPTLKPTEISKTKYENKSRAALGM